MRREKSSTGRTNLAQEKHGVLRRILTGQKSGGSDSAIPKTWRREKKEKPRMYQGFENYDASKKVAS